MILSGNIGVLAATVSFILGMMMMGNPKSALRGNLLLVLGMCLAIVSTILIQTNYGLNFPWKNLLFVATLIVIGIVVGRKVSFGFQLTKMPELVALFNGFGGLAAALIGMVGIIGAQDITKISSQVILLASIFLGVMTFSGSIVAFFKLGGRMKLKIKHNRVFTIGSLVLSVLLILQLLLFQNLELFSLSLIGLVFLSLTHGFFFSNAIGGGDMPILISVLNGLTGILTVISGIYFESTIMILAGVFVGATGIILTFQMCIAMNTSLMKVFIKSKSQFLGGGSDTTSYEDLKETSAAKLASDLMLAKQVVVVPGFGLAVAKAQKLCKELLEELSEKDTDLKFVIHPVAGRMPGHMNVLLAEAGIEYSSILDMDKGNELLKETDICLVIGANDVVNTSAENNSTSPIHGMPIIRTYNAKKVVVIKRGLSPGYAGIKNPLFENDNSELLFIDAKDALEKVISELKMN